jgi:hypothetical protein
MISSFKLRGGRQEQFKTVKALVDETSTGVNSKPVITLANDATVFPTTSKYVKIPAGLVSAELLSGATVATLGKHQIKRFEIINEKVEDVTLKPPAGSMSDGEVTLTASKTTVVLFEGIYADGSYRLTQQDTYAPIPGG